MALGVVLPGANSSSVRAAGTRTKRSPAWSQASAVASPGRFSVAVGVELPAANSSTVLALPFATKTLPSGSTASALGEKAVPTVVVGSADSAGPDSTSAGWALVSIDTCAPRRVTADAEVLADQTTARAWMASVPVGLPVPPALTPATSVIVPAPAITLVPAATVRFPLASRSIVPAPAVTCKVSTPLTVMLAAVALMAPMPPVRLASGPMVSGSR